MSAYTNAMVATLTANAPYNYDSASAFASENGLSVRSVISKVKSLGLEYTPRPAVVKSSTPKVRKADVVRALADRLDVDYDAIAGLEKADVKSLEALIKAL